ncbi:uncharacterized protein LOC124283408 [Haliotis rubra]|uniref:uncharacterized protein LOC124283408 n=1 Tax=Haliotis rubra TaxID=36100 RepID=UPI001EE4EBF5|nr:uncharacterized protein LOC124283408 [Haliotis rubra]
MAAVVPKYSVRRATRADVAAIKKLTDIEEWEIPTDFMYCSFDMDSRAWFVAESDSGEILACRFLVYYTEETVAGGIYIVRKDLRGKGIGRDVNAQSLKAVGDANVTISATFVNLYETHGFTFYYDIHLKRGSAEVILGAIPEAEVRPDIRILPYESVMFTELKAYDEAVCETERCYYFKNWIIRHAKHILIARSNTGRVLGYGRLAVTEYGHGIAPLYADSDVIAMTLLKRLLLQPKCWGLCVKKKSKKTKEEIEKKWKNMKSSGKKRFSTFHRATTTTDFVKKVCEPAQVFHIPSPSPESPQLYQQVLPQPQLPQPLHALMRERLQLEMECLKLKKRYLKQKLK